jgi:hypothetical protein
MCVMSMVHDHYQPLIPSPDSLPWKPFGIPGEVRITGIQSVDAKDAMIAELRQLISEFREAVAAAAIVDKLTRQPDCVDPEKKKLEDRVAELERRLNAMTEAARPMAPSP